SAPASGPAQEASQATQADQSAAPAAGSGASNAGAAPTGPTGAPAAPAAAVANQADIEPGITLITAVYNSIQDRFFRPLDSRDLLEAAWEGARRALVEQRKSAGNVSEPQLTGDRAGDLAAFVAQYRAL